MGKFFGGKIEMTKVFMVTSMLLLASVSTAFGTGNWPRSLDLRMREVSTGTTFDVYTNYEQSYGRSSTASYNAQWSIPGRRPIQCTFDVTLRNRYGSEVDLNLHRCSNGGRASGSARCYRGFCEGSIYNGAARYDVDFYL